MDRKQPRGLLGWVGHQLWRLYDWFIIDTSDFEDLPLDKLLGDHPGLEHEPVPYYGELPILPDPEDEEIDKLAQLLEKGDRVVLGPPIGVLSITDEVDNLVQEMKEDALERARREAVERAKKDHQRYYQKNVLHKTPNGVRHVRF